MYNPNPINSILLAKSIIRKDGLIFFDIKSYFCLSRRVLMIIYNLLPKNIFLKKLMDKSFHVMPWSMHSKNVRNIFGKKIQILISSWGEFPRFVLDFKPKKVLANLAYFLEYFSIK